jgi:hypothetical protein
MSKKIYVKVTIRNLRNGAKRTELFHVLNYAPTIKDEIHQHITKGEVIEHIERPE